MRVRHIPAAACAAAFSLMFTAVAPAALINPGFEADNAASGDVGGATGWSGFNSYLTTTFAAHSGTQSLKLFGPFFFGGGAGATQRIPVAPGDVVVASAFGLDNGAANDGIGGNNFALVQLQFFNGPTQIANFDSAVLNASTPDGVWLPYSAQGIAPAGATEAQIVLLHVQLTEPTPAGGAVFFDDASLAVVVPEPATAATLVMTAACGLATRRRRTTVG